MMAAMAHSYIQMQQYEAAKNMLTICMENLEIDDQFPKLPPLQQDHVSYIVIEYGTPPPRRCTHPAASRQR